VPHRLIPLAVAAALVAVACSGSPPTSAIKATTTTPTTAPVLSHDPGYQPIAVPGHPLVLNVHDVYPMTPGEQFAARPDFDLWQECGIRPCWLALRAGPDEEAPAITRGWPYEHGVGHEPADYLHVVCQVRGQAMTDENGQLNDIWDRVIVRPDKVQPGQAAALSPATEAPGYYGYAPDILLGNSGDHDLPC
jgi:hypothetical protein